ncbi:retrovirus-related pol polyprotein from transposon TNT 1-94 [Tanacetum coccineum]
MTGDRSQLTNFVNKFLGTVKFKNDHVAKILGYGDYQIGNVTISRVYYVEGLGHNLFSVRQFCDSNLIDAFRQHTCFIRNLEGVDLLTGSRGNNLYTPSLGDMMASSPISRHGLVRGLPKLKFEKDHLCSACAMGKSKKKPHKPKSKDTNQEKLYLLHMDLYGPMRVASVNEKKTDNGTEFVNQTLREYYEKVGISHETSVARSPQQNGVIERRNRTLIKAARTMLIYAKAPLFLWAEAVATALVRTELHEMTPAKINSSGLVPNPPPSTPFVPPSRTNWDLLFQPLFDELLNPSSSVDCPVIEVIAPIAEVNNDPFFGIPIPENDSEASSSTDVIPTVVQTAAPNSEHVTKWTKDYPLDNIIAIQEELNEFEHLEVWELVPRSDKVMYQLADIFTKALGRDRIEFLINKLGMRSFTSKTLKLLADEVDE